MSASLTHSAPASEGPASTRTLDQQRLWFVLAFPAVLAVLVTLVPIIGTAAIGPFLLVLVPLVLWAAFRDTERAIYVYFAWCWLDGMIRGLLHSSAVAIVARDIVLAVIVIGWGAQRLRNRQADPIRVPPGTLLVVLFIINCLLQVFNPFAAGLVQSIGGLKLHLSAIPLLFLGYDVIRRPSQLRSFFLFLALITLVVGVTSYVQYAHGPSWTWEHFPGTKEAVGENLSSKQANGMSAGFKPPGTSTGGGAAGVFAGVIFTLTFVLPLLSGRLRFSGKTRIALVALLLTFIVFIFINAVRSALVIALCGILLCGLLAGGRLRVRMLTAIAVCAILGALAFTVSQGISQGSVTSRFASTFSDPVDALHKDRRTFFDDAVFIVTHSPTGVGLGRVGAAGGRLGGGGSDPGFAVFSEAYLGSIMYETGIIGGLLISTIALSFIGRCYMNSQHLADPDSKLLATAITALFVIMFANFFVTPVLLGPPGSILFWLLGGASLRAFAPKARAA